MSQIIVPNVGERTILDQLIAGWNGGEIPRLKLFTNNYTPIATSVAGDFTEPTVTGYGYIDLDSWAAALTDPDGVAYTLHPSVTFSGSTGPVTVYGYFVTDDAGVLLWAVRFDASVSYGTGASVTIIPIMRLRQIP